QVLVQVRFHLALGLDHEAEVPAVAAQAGQHPQGVAAAVPQRVEQAGTRVEFAQAVGAPGQVVGFLLRGLEQVFAGGLLARHRGLAVVQALGADLADVVDPHQAGGMAAFAGLQLDVGRVPGGVGAAGRGLAEHGVERALGFHQQPVDRVQVAPGGRWRGGQGDRQAGWRGGHGDSGRGGPACWRAAARGARAGGGLRRPGRRARIPLLCSAPTTRGDVPRPFRPRNQPDQAPRPESFLMKTFTAKSETVQRDWYLVDATGKTLGRLSSELARRLRGKHKPVYTPHVDTGDYLIVINAEKIAVTGKKMTDKLYHRFTGHIGNLKTETLAQALERHPERVIEIAVKGMLPKNPLGRAMYRKLKVYKGAEHPHAAQQPLPLDI